LQPLVDDPDAVLLLRDACAARIQQVDAFLQYTFQARGNVLRGDLGAELEGGVDGGFEVLQIVVHVGFCRRNSRMRSAASTHCSMGGTREMRTRPAPGLAPEPARAR